jgi:MoxR-like ATPase
MAATGLDRAQDIADRIVANVERVVLGKTEQIRLVLAALACRGHVLLEDVPGTAKTVLARALTQSIEGALPARIQCTPDLQPTDVTGLSIYDQRTREFVFRPGPVFANVVLVDEINRAMPKTQSALLEAMAERQVTVDGVTRALPDPFLVIATENPLEYEGTFPLPEAQLDRFFLRTSLGYPGTENELRVLRDQRRGHPLELLEPAVTLDDLHALQDAVADVYMDELVELWIVRLVESTRTLDELVVGASVRGTIALAQTARAWALLHQREYVVPADVEELFLPVLGHRLLVEPSVLAESEELEREDVLDRVRDRCFALAPPPDAAEISAAAAAAAAAG